MKSLLVGVLVTCAVFAMAQSVETKCLVSEGQAYAFGNPRQIAVGFGSGVQPSPDGRYIAFHRLLPMDPLDEIRGRQMKPKQVFSVYDVQGDKLWDVVQSESAVQYVFTWSKVSGQGVLLQSRQARVDGKDKIEVLVDRLAAAQKQRSTATRYVIEPETLVDVSPDASRVLVSSPGASGASELYDLASGRRVQLPEIAQGSYRMWAPDGTLLVSTRNAQGVSVTALDLATLKNVAYSGDPSLYEDEPKPFYVFKRMLSQKEGGSTVLVASSMQAWETDDGAEHQNKRGALDRLVKSDPSLLGPVVLDADPSDQVVSGPGKYVAYCKRGGVYTCPFETIDPALLEKMLASRARAKAMSQSKQVALAIIMYTGDFDDKYPPNADWQKLVDPYMRNRELANGFNYTLDGNDATRLDDPAGTIMGSVDTPWGRAIAYADGHVKWIPAVNPEADYWSLVADDRRRIGA